jgi:hypothetical protein
VPPDSVWCTIGHVRCTRGLQLKLVTFGKFQRQLRYNSLDCPVYTGQCPVLQGRAASGTRQLRETANSCSAIIHRTCPVYTGLSGVSAGQQLFRRQRLPAAHLLRASARRSQARPCWRTGHSTVHVRCATGHPGGSRSQSSNGQNPTALVTWLAHRTSLVCTGLSGAPCDRQPHQTASLVVGAINTPNHPPFMVSKFSTSQLLTRALAFNSRHTKVIKSSPNSTQRP